MSLPSHRRISTNSSTQDFPHREPPLRIWVNITGSTQLLSQIQPLTRGNAQLKSPLHLKGQALSQTTNQPLTGGIRLKVNTNNNHLTLEGFPLNLHNHLSLEGGIQIPLPQSPLTRGISTLSPLTRGISTLSPLTRGISQSMEGLQL